jgi:hypothetical protein
MFKLAHYRKERPMHCPSCRSDNLLENLIATLWLYVADSNFVRIHTALRVAPAMAAGGTDHVWTILELLNAGARS